METKINGSIVLSKLQIENDEYQIISSAEDIVRFRTKNFNGEEVFETSPQILRIELYKNNQKIFLQKEGNCSFRAHNQNIDIINYYEIEQDKEGKETGTLVFEVETLVNLNHTAQNGYSIFIFEYKQNNNIVVSKAFQLRDGISDEMAKFNVTATAINQSVKDTTMSFTSGGLTINNGDFKIMRNNEQIFGFETIEGQERSRFIMKGAVYADEGSFTGVIHATEASFERGKIGGFEIQQGKLTSLATVEENGQKVAAIELDGERGNIIARNIQLGNNATIENQIRFGTTGSAYLRNPDKNNGEFIKSENIVIKNNGTAEFGEITINGNESVIYGRNWEINKDYANFSNVNVSGTIETVVFKKGSIQAAGGIMVFRPSYQGIIQDSTSTPEDKDIIYTIDLEEEVEPGTRLWLIDKNGGYHSGVVIEKIEKGIKVKAEAAEYPEDKLVIINLGVNDQEAIIGINSGNVQVENIIMPRGLTVTTLNAVSPNLFLGDLSGLTGLGYTGHGLYADNVYLNGSLTTQTGNNSYAGVNTLTGVQATAFSKGFIKKETNAEEDNSKIVFWAGASSKDSSDIQKAYFQVTENGSVYAQRAKLEDTLLVGGTIRAAEIYTAKLHGNGGALSIYDGSNGIQFIKSKAEGTEQIIFSIVSNGVQRNDKNIIKIEDQIEFIGDRFQTSDATNYLSLETNNNNGQLTPVLKHTDGENNCGFYFEKTETAFKMNEQTIQLWGSDGIKSQGNFELEKNGNKMQYKQELNGYNLYIVAS